MASEKTPIGKYPAVAVPMVGEDGMRTVRWGLSSNRNAQVLVYFKIIRGPRAGDVLPWFGSLSKDAYERTMQSLRYCGWKSARTADLEREPLDQEVEIEVGHNDWDGKSYARVDWVNPPGGAAISLKTPLVGQDLIKMQAWLDQRAAKIPVVEGARVDRARVENAPPVASGNGAAAAAAPPSASAPPPASDEPPAWGSGGGSVDPNDDIPFMTADAAAEPDPRTRWARWP